MYYSEKGESFKKFNTRDGMGVQLLHNYKIPVVIITGENSKIVLKRAKKLLIKDVFIGIKKKELLLSKICKKYQINENNIGYIGDDINDLEILKRAGFSACPMDGISIIKKNTDYVCKAKRWRGCFKRNRRYDNFLSKSKINISTLIYNNLAFLYYKFLRRIQLIQTHEYHFFDCENIYNSFGNYFLEILPYLFYHQSRYNIPGMKKWFNR